MTTRSLLRRLSTSRMTFVVVLAGGLAGSGGAASADAKADARAILDATGVKGGLIVHVGCGDGRLTAALRASDSYLVHGLDTDATNVAKAQNAAVWAVAPRRVTAFEAESGKLLWKTASPVLPMTLAADADGVYFHDGQKVVALDRATGKQKWASKPLARWNKLTSFYGATLLVNDGIVLFSGGAKMVPHRGGKDTMAALSAKTGKVLWTAEHPPSGYQSPEDMFVAQGRVWVHATTSGGYTGKVTAHNLKTGKVEVEFRHDATRSGRTDSAVSVAGLKSAWRTKLGGRLTAPTLAAGKIFVASIDTHTVHAIDSQTGKGAWQYTAGGRVDSPPTIWQGSVLFGSAR